MRLTDAEVERYFRVRNPLVSYTIAQMRRAGQKVPPLDWAHSGLKDETPWPGVGLVESFVAKNPARLNARDLALAESWKRAISGYFFAVRHLKKHTVFITERAPYKVYGAIGHHSELSALLGRHVPDLYELRLLPFEGRIVCNLIAFVDEYPASWPRDVRRRLEETYKRARTRQAIITSL